MICWRSCPYLGFIWPSCYDLTLPRQANHLRFVELILFQLSLVNAGVPKIPYLSEPYIFYLTPTSNSVHCTTDNRQNNISLKVGWTGFSSLTTEFTSWSIPYWKEKLLHVIGVNLVYNQFPSNEQNNLRKSLTLMPTSGCFSVVLELRTIDALDRIKELFTWRSVLAKFHATSLQFSTTNHSLVQQIPRSFGYDHPGVHVGTVTKLWRV